MQILCPHCKSSLSIRDGHPPTIVACPRCGGRFQTSAPEVTAPEAPARPAPTGPRPVSPGTAPVASRFARPRRFAGARPGRASRPNGIRSGGRGASAAPGRKSRFAPKKRSSNTGTVVALCVGAFMALGAIGFVIRSSFIAWRTFRAPDGSFSVDMPGTPEESSRTESTDVGRVQAKVYELATRSWNFGAGYVQFPLGTFEDAPAEDVFDMCCRQSCAAIGATPTAMRPITMHGRRGREVEFTTSRNPGRGRWLLDGDRLYVLYVIGSATRVTDLEYQRFFGTFRFQ